MLLRVAAASVLLVSTAHAATTMKVDGSGSGLVSYDPTTRTLTGVGSAGMFFIPRYTRDTPVTPGTFTFSMTFAEPVMQEVVTATGTYRSVTGYDIRKTIRPHIQSLTLTIRDRTDPSILLLQYTAPENSLRFLERSGYAWSTNGRREWGSPSSLCDLVCSRYAQPWNVASVLFNKDVGTHIRSDLPDFSVEYFNNGRRLEFYFDPLPQATKVDYDKPGKTAATNFAPTRMRFDINTAVPEPATWAMMIVGFGAVGVAMRRRAAPLPAA